MGAVVTLDVLGECLYKDGLSIKVGMVGELHIWLNVDGMDYDCKLFAESLTVLGDFMADREERDMLVVVVTSMS